MADTIELNITAGEIRQGDVFTLHGHVRTAHRDAWPVLFKGHVYIRFEGGGGATTPADRPITVTRVLATA
ncbi:hypothetical protein [Streptomyces sp. NPDC060001]|uniref:hypothetical protein n=1 Tax=Streptomyces sp. NPDC060001 TaxID=3347032 RepID=UPI00367B8FA1